MNPWGKSPAVRKQIAALKRLGIKRIPRIPAYISELFQQKLKDLAEKDLSVPEIAQKIGYSERNIRYVLRKLCPDRVVLRECPCGCGGTWDYVLKPAQKYAHGDVCKKKHQLLQLKNGEISPSEYRKCTVCQKPFPVYAEISASDRVTCGETCHRRWRASQIAKNSRSCADKKKKNTASIYTRQTYCTHTIDYEQVTCANYQFACGAGCLKTENGKPCCFVKPSP